MLNTILINFTKARENMEDLSLSKP